MLSSKTDDGRLIRFKGLLMEYEKVPTSRLRSKLIILSGQILASSSFDQIISEFHDSPGFWRWFVKSSVNVEEFLSSLSSDQLLRLVPLVQPVCSLSETDSLASTHLLLCFLAGFETVEKPDNIEVASFVMGLKQLEDLVPIAADLSRSNLQWLIGKLVNIMESLWVGCTGWWWENVQLRDLILLIHKIYLLRPDIPFEVYYSSRQSIIMNVQESLVLLRGNQQPRQMAKYIHKFYDLESKAKLIELENSIQMRHELQDAFFRTLFEGIQSTSLNLAIRREHIVKDALAQIETKKPYELRRQLRVKFAGEDGIDEGGLQKEFFQLLIKACFNPEYGIFRYHEESRMYWFCPTADDRMTHEAAEDCYAIGKLFGLAIYNSVLLDAHFPLALYKMLADMPIAVDDLIELDPGLGKGLKAILEMDEESFSASGLEGTPFEIEVCQGQFQPSKAFHFRLPSTHQALNYSNRHEFVQLYVEAILHRTVELPLQAFIRGFKFIFGKSIIFQFQPREIEALLCGSEEFDYGALQRFTSYDGFTAESPQVVWFWEIFNTSMTEKQRRRFLAFVTGTDRSPVGGLGKLSMKIVQNGSDGDRLPSAHTCFNTLLLNAYGSKERLEYWLLTAIENCSGFGLQ